MRNTESGTIHGDERVDAALQLLVEEVLDAPQVAQPFFPDRADERDAARRLQIALVHRPNHADEHGEAPAVVRDARTLDAVPRSRRLHVGALGENGIEVGAEDDVGSRRLARPLTQNIADGVDADVLQPERFERGFVVLQPASAL